MKFRDVLTQYEGRLGYAKRMSTADNLKFYDKTIEFWEGYKLASFAYFQAERAQCKDGFPKINYKLSKNDKVKLAAEGHQLCGKLNYRGKVYGIYNDDYGQQEYIILNGEIISGGSFNFCANADFAYIIDESIDDIRF